MRAALPFEGVSVTLNLNDILILKVLLLVASVSRLRNEADAKERRS